MDFPWIFFVWFFIWLKNQISIKKILFSLISVYLKWPLKIHTSKYDSNNKKFLNEIIQHKAAEPNEPEAMADP